MSERTAGGAQSSRVSASDLSSCIVLFFEPPAGGAGGGEQSGRTSRAPAKGRERTGASGGRVGEMENFSCSVALPGCFVYIILFHYLYAYCSWIFCQILYFGIPAAVLLYRKIPNQIPN